MEELILGFDICDDLTGISQYRPDNMDPADVGFPQADGRTVIQTAIGRKKGQTQWLVGKEAYMAVLEGSGVVVDKLLTLVSNGESAAVGDERFSPEELLTIFIGKLLDTVYELNDCDRIKRIVFTIEKFEPVILDCITRSMDKLGIGRERIHIISHTEAYLYFVLSQPKDMWNNMAVLFDWSSSSLHYYEMTLVRGVSPNIARVTHRLLESNLPQDDLNSESRQMLADSILTKHAREQMSHKLVTAVLICGKAMETAGEWGKNFLHAVGQRSKVYQENNIFSKGAVYVANDDLRDGTVYPYTIICEGRVQASIWLDVSYKGSRQTVYLAKEGSNWYDCKSSVDLLLDNTRNIRLKVRKSGDKLTLFENISLDAFPERPNKTTRVRLILSFVSEHQAVVRVQDLGFGEFYPSSGIVVKKEITIDQ